MSTTTYRMLWFAMLVGLMALAMGEVAVTEVDTASSESVSPVEAATTDAPPPREAVTDIFAAPLASFKVPTPPSTEEEAELTGLPLGKADNATDSATPPPFSNLWFNAGQSLGSAANSLTGWLNSRLGTQSTTITTTKPPEVIVRVQSQQGKRKPLIAIEPNRNPLGNRISPGNLDEDDDEDDDDDVDDEDYDAGEEEEEADDEETPPNRYSGADDEEDDDEEANDDEELDDDDEEEVKPVKKRTKFAPPKRANRKGYTYQAVDDDSAEDYEDDDDDIDDYEFGNPHSARQQQQQSFFNRFRQLAQMPYSSNNKKQATKQPNKGYRPVRIIQNGQVIQLVDDRPSQQKIKRQRRPAASQPTYQIIPIQANQIPGGGGSGRPQQKKRRVTKPQDTANNLYIPLPQGPSGSNAGQYITIPWSKLGITNKQQDTNQNGQQAPFIVNIPQMQTANRRRPGAQATNPQRKRLKRPVKNQNGKLVSILSEQNIRDIFRIPEIPPSRTPLNPLEVPVDDDSTSKPVAINPATEVVSEEDDDDEMQDEGEGQYIVVGEDESADQAMSRHASGGIKPYVDVLNKGRIYLKPGIELRRSRELIPQASSRQETTAINPDPIDEADKDVIRSLEASSESNSNDSPSLLVPDDAAVSPLPLQQ